MNQIRFCLVSKVSFIKWLSLALLYTPYFLFNLKYLGVESPWAEYQMTSQLTLAKYVLIFLIEYNLVYNSKITSGLWITFFINVAIFSLTLAFLGIFVFEAYFWSGFYCASTISVSIVILMIEANHARSQTFFGFALVIRTITLVSGF